VKHFGCDKCVSKNKGIFCDLEEVALADVSHNKVMNTYKKGQDIFLQGNPSFGLYCINSGKIKITKTGSDGKESIVRIASAGDVLGHRSLFTHENYSATATTLEDTTICFIDKKYIYNALKKEPSIALNLIQKLSREMGSAEEKSASLSKKSVKERLCELLINLKTSYGIVEGDRTRLDIKLTREEMASMIGTSVETVIRFMTELKDEGMIVQEGKVIFLINEKAILEAASLNF
jgi:CRP-like cAMP-binding protein